MSAPFVLITTHQLRPGRASDVDDLSRRYQQRLHDAEPGLRAFHAHLSDDGSRLSLLHVLDDSAAAEHHIAVAGPFIAEAQETLSNTRVEVYGVPGPALQAALDHNADAGTPISVQSRVVAGFNRGGRR